MLIAAPEGMLLVTSSFVHGRLLGSQSLVFLLEGVERG